MRAPPKTSPCGIGGIGIPGAGPLPSTAAIDLTSRKSPKVFSSAVAAVLTKPLGAKQELFGPVPMLRQVPANSHSLQGRFWATWATRAALRATLCFGMSKGKEHVPMKAQGPAWCCGGRALKALAARLWRGSGSRDALKCYSAASSPLFHL